MHLQVRMRRFFNDQILVITLLISTLTSSCSAEMCDVMLPANYSGWQPPIPRDSSGPLVITTNLFLDDLLEINDAEMSFKIALK